MVERNLMKKIAEIKRKNDRVKIAKIVLDIKILKIINDYTICSTSGIKRVKKKKSQGWMLFITK